MVGGGGRGGGEVGAQRDLHASLVCLAVAVDLRAVDEEIGLEGAALVEENLLPG